MNKFFKFNIKINIMFINKLNIDWNKFLLILKFTLFIKNINIRKDSIN